MSADRWSHAEEVPEILERVDAGQFSAGGKVEGEWAKSLQICARRREIIGPAEHLPVDTIEQFLSWAERASYQHLEDIEPITVAAYIEIFQRQAAPPTVNVEGEFHRKGLRPLRQPDSGLA